MIAVCPNPYRDLDLKITRRSVALLEEAGFETAVCPVFGADDNTVIPEDIKTVSLDDVIESCTMAAVIGGDGTILAVARRCYKHKIPVLGINFGTKGFMAGLELAELEKIVDAAKGNCEYTARMMLDVELIRGGEKISYGSVLNDVVLRGYSDCIKLTAMSGKSVITAFSGDGIIVSTPTGSTGYSMSAGGPIVEPGAKAMIISPICAHTMIARSFVLNASREIVIKPEKLHDRRAHLSLDGQIVTDLMIDDEVIVRQSDDEITMIDFNAAGFFEVAYKKLI